MHSKYRSRRYNVLSFYCSFNVLKYLFTHFTENSKKMLVKRLTATNSVYDVRTPKILSHLLLSSQFKILTYNKQLKFQRTTKKCTRKNFLRKAVAVVRENTANVLHHPHDLFNEITSVDSYLQHATIPSFPR